MNLFIKKIKSLYRDFKFDKNGQSLIEIIIALTIGVILIGGASTAIVVVLQSSKTSQTQQSATILAQGLIENVKMYSFMDWFNIYDLEKSSSTVYFLHTSSTNLFHIEGKEGMASGNIQNGLIGHWKMDEATSSTAYDFSGNGNAGTLQNGVTRVTSTCQLGYCLEFDGADDSVDIPASQDFAMANTTISMWINANDFNRWRGLLYIYENAIEDYLIIRNNGSGLNIIIEDDNSAKVNAHTPTLSTGDWIHIVFVQDGTNWKFYLDGSLSTLSGTNSEYCSNHLTIKSVEIGHSGWVLEYFNGLIDDVRIYNRALSADEVEHLYNSVLFNRYFYVENTCRTDDFYYNIAGVAPCGADEIDDSSTQKITAVVEWPGKNEGANFSLSEYVTKWKNDIFSQFDWSGGDGETGPITGSTNKFSSSTNLDYSNLGEIKIEGF